MPQPRPTFDAVKTRAFARLRRPLALTRAGILLERVTRAFWPFATILMVALAAVLLNAHKIDIPRELLLGIAGTFGVLALGTFLWGISRLKIPGRPEAVEKLDGSLAGRPITALGDVQVIGSDDPAAQKVWRTHVERMAEQVANARAPKPDLRVSKQDKIGLRLMAATVVLVGLIFGSIWRVGGVGDVLGADPAVALTGGSSWEGWVEPPTYTGLPSLYLADLDDEEIVLPEGTRITIRLYGELGTLSVSETVSSVNLAEPINPVQEFEVAGDGNLAIEGPGGRQWSIVVEPDQSPIIVPVGEMEWAANGELNQEYSASDDYGVISALAYISLDLDRLDRRHGLAVAPEHRDPLELDLPMPITGNRTEIHETLTDNMSEHPWARLPVIIELSAADALDQIGRSVPTHTVLPGRRFFDPLAKAVIEGRRDILWSAENGARTAQILRAVSHRPDDIMRNPPAYLKLWTVIRQIEDLVRSETFAGTARDEIAAVLWEIALQLEFGNLNDAKKRLERAQERLSEAIENGASDEEIAALVEELRQAMEEYMRQLAQQQQENQNQQAQNQQGQQMTGQDLQDMLERLQELMEQGRTEEAQELLDQLNEMMENMQITQGQQGEGQQSQGQQSMEELSETLREQQGLSDEAFRDLQEQFNDGATSGQSEGNTGRNGGMGQGQQHQGGQGQGQGENGENGDQQAQPGEGGQSGGQGGEENFGQSLADRQQALQGELDRQRGNLPGAGTPEGDAAREALGRAGEAMGRAEDDLRQDDLAGALDNQSEAMEALREGMRALGEAMAQQQQQQGQGQQTGDANPNSQRDPLGRNEGSSGRLGTDENLTQGDDVYRRARELLDEIRKRQGDKTRPGLELDYLERLLDRF